MIKWIKNLLKNFNFYSNSSYTEFNSNEVYVIKPSKSTKLKLKIRIYV